MSQEFLPDDNQSVRPNDGSTTESEQNSEQNIVCVTIVSSPKGVRETIFTLYQLGFADVEDWSPVQRTANPKQVMSVLIRRKRATDSKPPAKSS